MEIAYLIDWRSQLSVPTDADRIYFGHETCAGLLPPIDRACEVAATLAQQRISVTLITPFLPEVDLGYAQRLVDEVVGHVDSLEVVCSDWGFLEYVSRDDRVRPVLGRLLARQSTDPRIARMFGYVDCGEQFAVQSDGTRCVVRHRKPSHALASSLRGCWVDKLNVISFLQKFRVNRCELDNTSQGIELSTVEHWSYSLYLPNVLVTVMRNCPGEGEDFNQPMECGNCTGLTADRRTGPTRRVDWLSRNRRFDVFRIDNAIYYESRALPCNLGSLPIDRIVKTIQE